MVESMPKPVPLLLSVARSYGFFFFPKKRQTSGFLCENFSFLDVASLFQSNTVYPHPTPLAAILQPLDISVMLISVALIIRL